MRERECVLFIGTQFSNLYTAVDTAVVVTNVQEKKEGGREREREREVLLREKFLRV